MSPTTPAIPLTPSVSLTPSKGDDMVKVRELAHEFESMLLLQMIRQMRQSMAMSGDSDEASAGFGFGNEAMTDTVDSELARQLSLSGGVGVADVIVDGLSRSILCRGTRGGAAENAVRARWNVVRNGTFAPTHFRPSHPTSAPPHLDVAPRTSYPRPCRKTVAPCRQNGRPSPRQSGRPTPLPLPVGDH